MEDDGQVTLAQAEVLKTSAPETSPAAIMTLAATVPRDEPAGLPPTPSSCTRAAVLQTAPFLASEVDDFCHPKCFVPRTAAHRTGRSVRAKLSKVQSY